MKALRSEFLSNLMIIVFVSILQVIFVSLAEAMPPEEVVNAAEQGLINFSQNIPPQNFSQLGFLSQDEISKNQLGEAFQIYTIHPDDLLNFEKNIWSISDLLVPTNLWNFLILSDGLAKAVLMVDFFDNKWTAVGIGSSGLAVQLKKIIETWPLSSGYQHRFIRIYQANADFVEITLSGTTVGLIPLTSGRAAMDLADTNFNALDLHDPQNILTSIIPIVKENVKRWK